MNHHRDCGSDNDFNDPGGWDKASYSAHPIDSMEPPSDEPNPYRQAAIYHLQLMFAVDEFLTAAPDARVAVVAVAAVLGWPSARGLTLSNIADQLGCSPSTLTRSIARFREMAGLGVSAAGGARFIRPGAGSTDPQLTNRDTTTRRGQGPAIFGSINVAGRPIKTPVRSFWRVRFCRFPKRQNCFQIMAPEC